MNTDYLPDRVTGSRVWDSDYVDKYGGSERSRTGEARGVIVGPPLLSRFVNHVDRGKARENKLFDLHRQDPSAHRVYLLWRDGYTVLEIMAIVDLQKSRVYELLGTGREAMGEATPLPDTSGMADEERLAALERYPRPFHAYTLQSQGYEIREIAEQLEVSKATVDRDLEFARRVMGDVPARTLCRQLREHWRKLLEPMGENEKEIEKE